MTSPFFRAHAKLRRLLRGFLLAAAGSLFFAVAFIVGAILTGIGTISFEHWLSLPLVAFPFASLGALYGTVFVLDAVQKRPTKYLMLRVAICSLFGALTVYLWNIPKHAPAFHWLAVGAAVGALLGFIGWRWAKYVDF